MICSQSAENTVVMTVKHAILVAILTIKTIYYIPVSYTPLETGRGYVSAERNKQAMIERGKNGTIPIGVIPMDSVFTPIRKVSYSVEDTRVGQVTDYDKLTIEVWTNGSILPKEALAAAAQIITNNMRLFIDLTVNVVRVDYNEPESYTKEKVLEMTIEELDLSVRAFNCLKRAGIHTVHELVQRNQEEMMLSLIHT